MIMYFGMGLIIGFTAALIIIHFAGSILVTIEKEKLLIFSRETKKPETEKKETHEELLQRLREFDKDVKEHGLPRPGWSGRLVADPDGDDPDIGSAR